METGKRTFVVALILLSSGFAYTFGRQQAEREICEEFGVRLEAMHASIRPPEPDADPAVGEQAGDPAAPAGPANRPAAASR